MNWPEQFPGALVEVDETVDGDHLGDGIEYGKVDPGLVKLYLAFLIHSTPLSDPGTAHDECIQVLQ